MSATVNDKRAIMELERSLKEAEKSAKQRFQIDHPKYAKLVKSKSTHRVYKKRPEGYSKVIPDIVELMTCYENIEKTQVQLIEAVSELHPEQSVTKSVWYKDLQAYEIKGIKETLEKCGFPNDLARGCKKLSQVRKKMKLYMHEQENEPRTFKTTISIHNSMVVIDKKSFPVTLRRSGGEEYPCIRVNVRSKRCWVRVDALAVALFEGEGG